MLTFTARRALVVLSLFCLSLTACSTLTSTGPVSLERGGSWVILPVRNLSVTPQAGEMVQTLMETELRSRGVGDLVMYQPESNSTLVALLDDSDEIDDATNWGRESGARYGLTGTVHEWHYKSGPDKEPAAGLSLKLIDFDTNRVVWQASGSRTGWGYANLSSVGAKLIDGLLEEFRLH